MASDVKANSKPQGGTDMKTTPTNLLPKDATQLDDVDQYFECLSECAINDQTCTTVCKDEAFLDVPSY